MMRNFLTWGLVVGATAACIGMALWAGRPEAEDAPAVSVKLPPDVARSIPAARHAELERFAKLRSPSDWQKLLDRKLGGLALRDVPTARAVAEVAERLGMKLAVAPGIAGAVTFVADAATLRDFVQKGLAHRYWYLALQGSRLHLRPHVGQASITFSSKQGQHYNEHSDELEKIASACGAMAAYDEHVRTDPAGTGRVHGRLWFIDRVKSYLREQGILTKE